MAKSYKQMYEELKAQTQPLTEEEILALKAVAHGCNINKKLFGGSFLEGATQKIIRFDDALETVYSLIERSTPDDSK